MPHLIGIERINRAFKEGASKLAHSKGFASGKKYAALGGTPAFPANRGLRLSIAQFAVLGLGCPGTQKLSIPMQMRVRSRACCRLYALFDWN